MKMNNVDIILYLYRNWILETRILVAITYRLKIVLYYEEYKCTG